MNDLEAKNVEVGGVALSCKHCGKLKFRHRQSRVNNAGLAFLKLEILDPHADIYICDGCGFLHWFLDPEDFKDTRLGGDLAEVSCLSCGAEIPPEVEECGKCGWTYREADAST